MRRMSHHGDEVQRIGGPVAALHQQNCKPLRQGAPREAHLRH